MSYRVELAETDNNGRKTVRPKDGYLFTTTDEVNEYIETFAGSYEGIVTSGWEDVPTHHLEIDATSGLEVAVAITDTPIDIEPLPIEPTPVEI